MMAQLKHRKLGVWSASYYEIWFDLYDGSTPYSIKVEGLSNAREAWDRLAKEFFMRSTRP